VQQHNFGGNIYVIIFIIIKSGMINSLSYSFLPLGLYWRIEHEMGNEELTEKKKEVPHAL
jgi:hypothetical protein